MTYNGRCIFGMVLANVITLLMLLMILMLLTVVSLPKVINKQHTMYYNYYDNLVTDVNLVNDSNSVKKGKE
jgi:hypothetical protein